MIRIDIRPVWRFNIDGRERDFDFMLISLLEALDAEPKLTRAAARAGISYRHAWNLIGEWQQFFDAPLVEMTRGRGSTLTPLGERLLWAVQRARARLAPDLDSLASEFAAALNAAYRPSRQRLTLHASHDFAVAALRELTAPLGFDLDVQYRGGFDALASLARGECGLAGFHLPEGRVGAAMAARYAAAMPPACRLIALAARTQGFIVRGGNPKGIRTIADLARADVRMVNRQRGSGTRALLDLLIDEAGLDRRRLDGYESAENTHAAVAALIAGGQADCGFGVQAAAAQYRLDFVPLLRERYCLACPKRALDSTPVTALRGALRSDAFAAILDTLPGYSAWATGEALDPATVLEPALART